MLSVIVTDGAARVVALVSSGTEPRLVELELRGKDARPEAIEKTVARYARRVRSRPESGSSATPATGWGLTMPCPAALQ